MIRIKTRIRTKTRTKKEVYTAFRDHFLCEGGEIRMYERIVGRVNMILRSEHWVAYLDGLCKDGLITEENFKFWTNPFKSKE